MGCRREKDDGAGQLAGGSPGLVVTGECVVTPPDPDDFAATDCTVQIPTTHGAESLAWADAAEALHFGGDVHGTECADIRRCGRRVFHSGVGPDRPADYQLGSVEPEFVLRTAQATTG